MVRPFVGHVVAMTRPLRIGRFNRRSLIRPGKIAQRGSSRTDTADRCAT